MNSPKYLLNATATVATEPLPTTKKRIHPNKNAGNRLKGSCICMCRPLHRPDNADSLVQLY